MRMLNKFSKKSLIGTLVLLGALTLVSFQNCSPTKFNSDLGSSSLKSEGSGDTGMDPNPEDPIVTTQIVVECEMLSPNSKITLSEELALAANKSSTRICMSEYACVKILNDFAVKHNCSLDKNEQASSAGTQCTKIFPGSKGTCHNATVLSDDEVKELLKK
jgi:hypothetical protein